METAGKKDLQLQIKSVVVNAVNIIIVFKMLFNLQRSQMHLELLV